MMYKRFYYNVFVLLAYEITTRQPLLYNHKVISNPDSTNITETLELIKNLCTMSEVCNI